MQKARWLALRMLSLRLVGAAWNFLLVAWAVNDFQMFQL
jgi:hypothetical protein